VSASSRLSPRLYLSARLPASGPGLAPNSSLHRRCDHTNVATPGGTPEGVAMGGKKGVRIRAAVPQLLAMLLCACSVAHYKQPISAFSAATKTASATFDTYANSLDQVQHDQNLSEIVKKPSLLTVPAQDCGPTSKQCRLFVTTIRGRQPLKASLLPSVRKI